MIFWLIVQSINNAFHQIIYLKGSDLMNKIAPTMVAIAALGAAAAVGYNYMKPQAKQQLARDAKMTMRDMGEVKDEMSIL